MLKKLLMGSKKQYKLFIIPKITQVNVNEYEILSDIYPKNDHYLNISSMKTSVSGSGISFADHVVTGSAMEKVVFTRLDSGKTLEISTVASEQGYEGLVKVGSELELFLQKSDVGKTIEITIEPGGLIGFFRRLVTFLRGGLRNAKKNDANEQHPIANWSRGICDSSTNNKYNCSKGVWICVGSTFRFSYRKYQSSILSRARNTQFYLWISRVSRRWHDPLVQRFSKILSAYICPTIRQFSDIQTGSNSNWKLRRLLLHIVKKYIFTRGRRQRNPFINPWRVASSALCAGGCHA